MNPRQYGIDYDARLQAMRNGGAPRMNPRVLARPVVAGRQTQDARVRIPASMWREAARRRDDSGLGLTRAYSGFTTIPMRTVSRTTTAVRKTLPSMKVTGSRMDPVYTVTDPTWQGPMYEPPESPGDTAVPTPTTAVAPGTLPISTMPVAAPVLRAEAAPATAPKLPAWLLPAIVIGGALLLAPRRK